MCTPIIDFAKCGLLVEDKDIEKSELKNSGEKLFQAFSASGFAYLSNSGVDMNKVDELNRIYGEFFRKDTAYKERYCLDDITFGYDKMGVTRVNPQRPYDYQEGFHASSDSLTDRCIEWPDIHLFEKRTKVFGDICRRLAIRVLQALGEGMKLKHPDILQKSHALLNRAGNHTSLRIISYPGITSADEILPHQTRVGEHSDWGTITLLFQDDVGGLQVKNPYGNFVNVDPIPGTIVVNVGDMLAVWSANKLNSGVHRVILPEDPDLRRKSRRSIAYFVNADDTTPLSKLEYQNMERNSLHETMGAVNDNNTAYDYIKTRYRDMFSGDAI